MNRHRLFAAILLLACVLAYAPSLRFGFVLDDRDLVVENPRIKTPAFIGKLIRADMFDLSYEGRKPNYHRPLAMLSYMLDYRAWRLNPFGYHLTGILVHFLNSVLVYLLVYSLFADAFMAAACGLLFAVHPIHGAAVVFVSGRSDLLAAFFMLSAFLCMVLSLEGRMGKRLSLASIFLLSLLALFSRENAVLLPLGFLFLSFFLKGEARHKAACVSSGAFAVILFLYVRLALLNIPLARQDYGALSIFWKVINFFYILASYLALLVNPYDLHLMHVKAPIVSLSEPRFWLVAGAVALSVFSLYIARRRKAVVFGAAWFIIFVSQAFFLMTGFPGSKISMFEHWVYLASAGIFMLVGGLFSYFRRRAGAVAYPLFAAVVVTYSALAWVQQAPYRSSEALSEHMLRFNPDNKEAHKELGRILLEKRQYADAFVHLQKAAQLDAFDPDIHLIFGAYYEAAGRPEDALASYEAVLRLEPRSGRAHNNIGAIRLDKGDLVGSELEFRQAIALSPQLFEPYLNMAESRRRARELSDAAFFYMQAIKLNPDRAEPFVSLARMYLDQGEPRRALDVLNHARACGHTEPLVSALLGIASAEAGSGVLSQRYFEEALRCGRRSQEAALAVGIFYCNKRQFDKALEVWEDALREDPANRVLRQHIDRAEKLFRESGRERGQ